MYPRSFLCEEAKIKQRTSLKKELCEIVRKQYGNPDSHPFFNVFLLFSKIFFDAGYEFEEIWKILFE